jgi:hypothetical protein
MKSKIVVVVAAIKNAEIANLKLKIQTGVFFQ